MTIAVVSAEEHAALEKRLAELERRLRMVETGSATGKVARDYLVPKQVARRFGISEVPVYEALEKGALRAETVKLSRGRVGYRIQIADAKAWYDRHIRKADNQ